VWLNCDFLLGLSLTTIGLVLESSAFTVEKEVKRIIRDGEKWG